jgi:hypothetical protein
MKNMKKFLKDYKWTGCTALNYSVQQPGGNTEKYEESQ